MSKELREDAQLIELVRQINFLLTGRYVSVNTTPIQKAIDRYAAEREKQARIDELKMLRQGSKENAKDGKGFDFVTSIISRINDLKETTNE